MAITSVANVEEQEVEMFGVALTPFHTPVTPSKLMKSTSRFFPFPKLKAYMKARRLSWWQGLWFYMRCLEANIL